MPCLETGLSSLFLGQTTFDGSLQERELFCWNHPKGKDNPCALVFVKMKLESGKFIVKNSIDNLRPVNKIEVLAGLDEWENFDAEGGKDDVGVPGAIDGNFSQ